MMKKTPIICMFVLNPCINDTRVLKEAHTLGKAGYDVRIIAVVSEDRPDFIEEKDSFRIYRVQPRSALFYLKKIHYFLKKTLKILYVKKFLKYVEDYSEVIKERIHGKAIRDKAMLSATGDPSIFLKLLLAPLVVFVRVSKLVLSNALIILIIICRTVKEVIREVLLYPFIAFWKAIKKHTKNILWKYHRISTYISYWLTAGKLACGFRADVYHAHDLNTLVPAYWAARKTEAKAIYDSHELYRERNKLVPESAFYKWIKKTVEAFLVRRVNAVITVNNSIAEELSRLYNVPVPYVVMNCPEYRLGTKNNILRGITRINGNRQIILYLGAITFNRGLEEAIEAIQKVDNGVLAVMGYGKPEYISDLKERVSRLGVEEKVYFVPPVAPHEVVKYAASADIGLVPIQNACKSYYYCSPNKLFESMMAGLPVAASDFPELSRIIQETNCGRMFDSANPDDIAGVLNEMISNREATEKMGHNALQHAHKYSWEEESKKLISLYDNLLSGQ